ncbi:hypothetical protein [Oerskovia merdavium]|uniref:Uncharacterized protein n=1 Tax=Oerskovia merdavium TaxID=2762227 RepID=A0ABR8U4U1_9CELL|nr:hypothetical protein [Oerskovia merdavium]MBD7982770.1 hypothetical protein [Oerskovia merdavium]
MNTTTTTRTHVPRVARWSEDRAKFAQPTDFHEGATPSGLYIWDATRRVDLTSTAPGARQARTQRFEHGTILGALSDHIDHLPDNDPRTLTAEAAYELVLSDLETGTSLAAWPTMRRIVEHALTQMLGVPAISTEWPEF